MSRIRRVRKDYFAWILAVEVVVFLLVFYLMVSIENLGWWAYATIAGCWGDAIWAVRNSHRSD